MPVQIAPHYFYDVVICLLTTKPLTFIDYTKSLINPCLNCCQGTARALVRSFACEFADARQTTKDWGISPSVHPVIILSASAFVIKSNDSRMGWHRSAQREPRASRATVSLHAPYYALVPRACACLRPVPLLLRSRTRNGVMTILCAT